MSRLMETTPVTEEQLAQHYRGAEKPNGLALATFLASGIGAAALGILTTAAVISADFKSFLAFNKAVGPLAGKTTYAAAVWLVTWVALGIVMRNKSYAERPIFTATFVLIAIGVVGTFPLFYDLFAR